MDDVKIFHVMIKHKETQSVSFRKYMYILQIDVSKIINTQLVSWEADFYS